MSKQEQIMRRYLLGEMTEAERAELEQDYFDDGRLFERMVEAENELIDEYARGLLPPPVRERFERHYLSHPSRRARSLFAEAWAAKLGRTAVAESSPRAESSWGRWLGPLRGPKLAWAFAAALLLAAAGAAWLWVGTRAPRQELAKTEDRRAAREPRAGESPGRTANERQSSERPPGERERPRTEEQSATPLPNPTPKPAPAFATLVLTVGGTRSAEAAPPALLVIPARTEKARLLLNLGENDYKSYRAALRPAGGGDIYTWGRVTPGAAKSGARLALTLPARMLANGDYLLTLRGVGEGGEVEDVSKTLFRVRKE
jgi:hypothetical protein